MILCFEFFCVFFFFCDLVVCFEDCENFFCEFCFYVFLLGGCCFGWFYDIFD